MQRRPARGRARPASDILPRRADIRRGVPPRRGGARPRRRCRSAASRAALVNVPEDAGPVPRTAVPSRPGGQRVLRPRPAHRQHL